MPETSDSRLQPAVDQGLLTKQGQIIVSLAGQLASAKPGERLLPVQEYAELFQAAAGTLQNALDYLQEIGAAKLDARGRLGTYVVGLDYAQLWQIGFRRPLIGAVPLPYTRHIEGLATALHAQCAAAHLPAALRFMRGSTERLQALAASTVDWALVSKFAARTAHAHGFAVTAVLALGPHSYLDSHVLLMRSHLNGRLPDGARLGVDFLSTDHTYVSRAISRGKKVELVKIQYDQSLELLAAGAIDAVVWTNHDVPVSLADITIVPLEAAEDPELAELSEAVLVTEQGRTAVGHLLPTLLNIPDLLAIQRAVIDRVRIPSY